MAVIETDTAWWAILLSYLMLVGFTVGIGLRDNDWDTVSDMVARADRTLHGFAMVTILVIICQVYWVYTQLQRWVKRLNGWKTFPFQLFLIATGTAASVVGTAGFGIVSTNLSADQHYNFAATGFSGVLLYLFGILLLEFSSYAPASEDAPAPHSRTFGALFWAVAMMSLIMLGLDEPFWWEYILITSLHMSALAFTIPMHHRLFYAI